MNIGSLLPRHARFRSDHPCFVMDAETFTYQQFNAHVNKLAHGLLLAGVKKGDKCAAVLSNSTALMALYWAAAKTGIVIVPASSLLQGSGLITLLNDCHAAIVFADASYGDFFRDQGEKFPAIKPLCMILVGNNKNDHPDFMFYDDFIAGQPDSEPPDAKIVDDDVYNIMYSSGTTGAPKGIIHTHYVRANYCTHFAGAYRMTPESIVLHAGSIVFNGCMLDLMPWMYLGATYILHGSFEAGAVLKEIEKSHVTHTVMVPSQIIQLLDHPDFKPQKLQSLEMVLSLGAPLLLDHKKRLNAALPGRFYELYGLTEGFMTILDRTDAVSKQGSVGTPPAFHDMKIIREDGSICDAGEVGEICGRGPVLMPGYYNRPDLTEKAIIDGWLHTGDAGYVDEDGYLYLVDRIKDMIISGGVNVYPKDIEEIAITHPDIAEVAVFGAPDDKWGEVPIAAVLLKKGSNLDPIVLTKWVNERAQAKYQRLKNIIVLDEFPRNVAGKTLKREILEIWLSGH